MEVMRVERWVGSREPIRRGERRWGGDMIEARERRRRERKER